MKRHDDSTSSPARRSLRVLSSAELENVTGGAWAEEWGGSGDLAWIPPTAPTIPDIGWDSYFWFA